MFRGGGRLSTCSASMATKRRGRRHSRPEATRGAQNASRALAIFPRRPRARTFQLLVTRRGVSASLLRRRLCVAVIVGSSRNTARETCKHGRLARRFFRHETVSSGGVVGLLLWTARVKSVFAPANLVGGWCRR